MFICFSGNFVFVPSGYSCLYIFVHGLSKLVGHIGGLDASIVEGHNDYREMFYCGCSCSSCE